MHEHALALVSCVALVLCLWCECAPALILPPYEWTATESQTIAAQSPSSPWHMLIHTRTEIPAAAAAAAAVPHTLAAGSPLCWLASLQLCSAHTCHWCMLPKNLPQGMLDRARLASSRPPLGLGAHYWHESTCALATRPGPPL